MASIVTRRALALEEAVGEKHAAHSGAGESGLPSAARSKKPPRATRKRPTEQRSEDDCAERCRLRGSSLVLVLRIQLGDAEVDADSMPFPRRHFRSSVNQSRLPLRHGSATGGDVMRLPLFDEPGNPEAVGQPRTGLCLGGKE